MLSEFGLYLVSVVGYYGPVVQVFFFQEFSGLFICSIITILHGYKMRSLRNEKINNLSFLSNFCLILGLNN